MLISLHPSYFECQEDCIIKNSFCPGLSLIIVGKAGAKNLDMGQNSILLNTYIKHNISTKNDGAD